MYKIRWGWWRTAKKKPQHQRVGADVGAQKGNAMKSNCPPLMPPAAWWI
jgi:hypothetical protein